MRLVVLHCLSGGAIGFLGDSMSDEIVHHGTPAYRKGKDTVQEGEEVERKKEPEPILH